MKMSVFKRLVLTCISIYVEGTSHQCYVNFNRFIVMLVEESVPVHQDTVACKEQGSCLLGVQKITSHAVLVSM